jgi:DNA-binding transcriptional LysR family regulator
MNLRQIEIFRTIMETGSVTEAARQLGISQPAVSKALKHFERELGFQAFLRGKKRLEATTEAAALFGEVERVFLNLDYLKRFASDLMGLRRGHLVVGAPYSACTSWIPGVMKMFLEMFPGLSASLQVMETPKVAHAVSTGRLDLGILQFELQSEDILQEPLLANEAVCVLPPHHRLAERKCIRPEDLRDEDFVALAPDDRYRQQLELLMRRRNIPLRIRIDTPLASAACGFVVAGMGIAMIDRLSATENLHRGIVVRRFAPRISERLVLVLPANRKISRPGEVFADHLRQHSRALGDVEDSPFCGPMEGDQGRTP